MAPRRRFSFAALRFLSPVRAGQLVLQPFPRDQKCKRRWHIAWIRSIRLAVTRPASRSHGMAAEAPPGPHALPATWRTVHRRTTDLGRTRRFPLDERAPGVG